MKAPVVVAAAIALTAMFGCRQAPPPKQYELTGQILAIKPEKNEVVVKHDDIKNFMPAMTMPYKVKEPALLTGRKEGDLIRATLVVGGRIGLWEEYLLRWVPLMQSANPEISIRAESGLEPELMQGRWRDVSTSA